jgi:Sorting nexin C terminal
MLAVVENVIRVMFHGVASRTLREKYRELTSPVYLAECIHMLLDTLWPDGKVLLFHFV